MKQFAVRHFTMLLLCAGLLAGGAATVVATGAVDSQERMTPSTHVYSCPEGQNYNGQQDRCVGRG